MKFTLFINGEEKTFSVPFVKGRMLRTALKMNKTLGQKTDLDDEILDELVDFVCNVFDNQFTSDQVFDGLPVDGMFIKLQSVLSEVVKKALNGINVEGNGASNPKNG